MVDRHPLVLAALLIGLSGPTASIAAENVPVHQCDRLAAHPADYERAAPPVEDSEFLPKQAAVACRDAVAAYPDAPRFRFQLGRALLALEKIDEAKEVLQGAADGRYAVASLYLARFYVSRSHGERDVAKAFEYVQLAAEQGHQDSQVWLGLIYRDGTGVETNLWQAFNWFKKAADQGNPEAHAMLGVMYQSGEHNPPGEHLGADLELAVKHFEIAAEAGDPLGQFALGLKHLDGFLVEKDTARGLELMEAAAEQGLVVAAWTLGDRYMRGEGLPLDRERAIYWFCRTGAVGTNAFRKTYNEELNCDGQP